MKTRKINLILALAIICMSIFLTPTGAYADTYVNT